MASAGRPAVQSVEMSLVEGESFDILVVSGFGEGLGFICKEFLTTERSFLPNVPSWQSCRVQWNAWST